MTLMAPFITSKTLKKTLYEMPTYASLVLNSIERARRNNGNKRSFSFSKNPSFVPIAHICTSLWIKVPLQAAAPQCTARGLQLFHSTITSRGAEITELRIQTQLPRRTAQILFFCLFTCALQFCAGQLLAISGKLPALRHRAITDHYGERINLSATMINGRLADCHCDKLTRQIRPIRDWVMGLWPTSEAFSRKKKQSLSSFFSPLSGMRCAWTNVGSVGKKDQRFNGLKVCRGLAQRMVSPSAGVSLVIEKTRKKPMKLKVSKSNIELTFFGENTCRQTFGSTTLSNTRVLRIHKYVYGFMECQRH